MGKYSSDKTRLIHMSIIDAFVGARTVSVHGRRYWDAVNVDDQMTTYVLSSTRHHMLEAIGGAGAGAAPSHAQDALVTRLNALPHDVIILL